MYPEQVITLMREGRIEALAERVRYPLKRTFPLSSLWQPADFVERYDEIFDEAYRQKIIASTEGSWNHFGWRGRSYEGLWVDEDEDIIRAINHESPAEEARRLALIESIRAILHPSLQDFAEPLEYMETAKFKIWIDKTADGSYRYASWSRRFSLSGEPDLVLTGGSLELSGSMGGKIYTFTNGDVQYQVFASGSAKSGRPYITVEQGGKQLLRQEGQWVDLATVVADPSPGPDTFAPTGRETLQSYVAMESTTYWSGVETFLKAHRLTLLEHSRIDSLEGNDPVPYGEHPSVTETYTIGSCNTVEAFWVLAAYLSADWYPQPSSPSLVWKDHYEPGQESAGMANPNQPEYLWDDGIVIIRKKGTGEILSYQAHIRGEGGGGTISMDKQDGYTWVLKDYAFAD
jgi:hypothetical protein